MSFIGDMAFNDQRALGQEVAGSVSLGASINLGNGSRLLSR